jgi:ABC-type transporter MlaC component
MHVTDVGRRRVQTLDFAKMIDQLMEDGADGEDLVLQTAMMMCTDENYQVQMTDRAISEFIKSHLPEIKAALSHAIKRLRPEASILWHPGELAAKKPIHSEGSRQLTEAERQEFFSVFIPLLMSKTGQWRDTSEGEHKPFEDDSMSPEDLKLYKETMIEAAQQANVPVDSVISLFQRVSGLSFSI